MSNSQGVRNGWPRRLIVEPLEDRSMLTALTVIAHGFQFLEIKEPDTTWMVDLAKDINSRLDVADRCDENEIGTSNCDHFLIHDWSGYASLPGAVEIAATDLYWDIRAILEDPVNNEPLDLHFIGHSRGTSVISEAIKLLQHLPNYDSEVDWLQMTTLDPHPAGRLGQVLDAPFLLNPDPKPERPDGLGTTSAADNYYQLVAYFPGLFPAGMALSWAQPNRLLPFPFAINPHSYVHQWYADNFSTDWYDTKLYGDAGQGAPGVNTQQQTNPKPDVDLPDDSLFPPKDDDDAPKAEPALTVALPSSGSITTPGSIDFPGDHDRFRIRTFKNGVLKVEVGTVGSSLDSFVTVYDENLNSIRSDNNNGPGMDAQVFLDVVANQTFVVDVSGAGRSTGSYLLLTSQPDSRPTDPATNQPSVPPPLIDDYPNSKPGRQIALDATGGATIDGNVHAPGDDDWFAFTTRKAGNLVIEIDTPQSSLDTHLRLHNSAGILLNQDHSYIQRPVSAGETFWLHVRAGDDKNPPNINPGEDPTGRYVVGISQSGHAPGNSGSDTQPIPLTCWANIDGVHINLDPNGDGSSSGSIDEPSQADFFQVNNVQAGFLDIRVAGVNDDLKEFVTVFRCGGGGVDTDSGEFDGDAHVAFSVDAGEKIIVAVGSHDGRFTGGYELTVSQPAKLPDDDLPDFGENPVDLSGDITPEGNGFRRGRIERPEDDDWFKIPIRGKGYLHVEVEAADSALVPFLKLNRDGTSGGFFETDDGRDGRAHVAFLPTASMDELFVNVSALDETQGKYTLRVWRSANRDDDHPDSGGAFAAPHRLEAGGNIFIRGRIEHPRDKDAFRVEPDQPGPVAIQVISLTEGFQPFLEESWQPADSNNDLQNTDGGSGRGGRTFHVIDSNVTHVNIDVRYSEDEGQVPHGDYMLHVWQPNHKDDFDADTVGIEASPIMLDGSGNGMLPGSPNGTELSPGLNFAGDVDVFQVRAASNRPMTFTVSGQDTFLRVYDGSNRSIATDHNSGPDGASQITLEANRSDLFYLEISGNDGDETGTYTVQISQPADDHPDAAIFTPLESQTSDATVIVLDPTGTAAGRIDGVGDRDWFQSTVAKRGEMTVDVETTDNKLDTIVRVYDGRGQLVAIDDDGGDARNSRVSFTTFQGETYFIEVGGYGDNSVGDYVVKVDHKEPPSVEVVGMLDEFSSGFDTSKWSLTYAGQANLGVAGGAVRLEANGNGAPNDNNTVTLVSRAYVVDHVSFDLAGEFGGSHNYGFAEVTDGTNYVRVQLNRAWPSPDNVIAVGGSGYQELQNNAPLDTTTVAFNENQVYRISFQNENGEVHVYMDDTLLARFSGEILPHSFLKLQSRTAAAADRYANLTLGNVGGSFAISDPLPVTMPATTTTITGTFDAFEDNVFDASIWSSVTSGQGTVIESNETLILSADGPGALDDNNTATIDALAFLQGDVEFDLVARLGKDSNSAFAEVTDGTNFIRVLLDSGANNSLRMNVQSNGYTELENAGLQSISEGTRYGIAITHTDEGIEVLRDHQRIALFEGTLRLNSVLRGSAVSDASASNIHLQSYDTFDDNNIDAAKWHLSQDSTGQGIEEVGGGLVLYAVANSGSRTHRASTNNKPGGDPIRGGRWEQSYIDGTQAGLEVWTEITNGTDYIRIVHLTDVHDMIVRLGGVYGSGDGARWNGQGGTVEIVEANGDVNIYFNGQLKQTVSNRSIVPDSYFAARAKHVGGSADGLGDKRLRLDDVQFYRQVPSPNDRFAELALDNIVGDFQLSRDAVRRPYDGFDDNEINQDKWHIVGAVQESDGSLKLGLFEGSQPVQGYVSTANISGGTNLRGFKLNFTRTTEPKNIGAWDARTRFELTNGVDFIRIANLHKQTWNVETSGAYGNNNVEFSVPPDQIPDGPYELRETHGDVEILHNNHVVLTIPGQTVRAGSFFQFETHGNPFGQSMPGGPPQDYTASIDDVIFYVDPVAPEISPPPALTASSDSGQSNTDHVTNQLSPNVEWPLATAGTKYQWRSGELQQDGTANWNEWSDPLSGSSTDIHLANAGIHVVSVRAIDADGFVGQEASRAFVVDAKAPEAIHVDAPRDGQPKLVIEFSEPVVVGSEDLTILNAANQPVVPSSIDGSGTTTLEISLPASAIGQRLSITLNSTNSVADVAGNRLDGDNDGSAGGDFQASTFVPLAVPIGVHRNTFFFVDANGTGAWDVGDNASRFGIDTDTPIIGDWDGDGRDEIGVHRGREFFLDMTGDGRWNTGDAVQRFGIPGDTPIVGDWNGDGADQIGVHRGRDFFLDMNVDGRWSAGDVVHRFGIPGDTPIVGDWNGDGADQIGVHRNNFFFLDVTGDGRWNAGDSSHRFGIDTDHPIIGDWDGNGVDQIGVHRGRNFFLDDGDGRWKGVAKGDLVYAFGIVGDTAIVGDWQPPQSLVTTRTFINFPHQPRALTASDLTSVVETATEIWSGVTPSSGDSNGFKSVAVFVADLPGTRLAHAIGNSIVVDVNAAGYGWFVDPTPRTNEEFSRTGLDGLIAAGDSAASGQMDLLTVVLHEFGHLLGLKDDFTLNPGHVMRGLLEPGTRRLPS